VNQAPCLDDLTPMQRHVAMLVGDGHTNKQIAAALLVHPSRIRCVVGRIAVVWQLDRAKDLRVQIANRLARHVA
jgi:DNA-binding NarL/FixJ family response regulator